MSCNIREGDLVLFDKIPVATIERPWRWSQTFLYIFLPEKLIGKSHRPQSKTFRGRLLLGTPGPVPCVTCICSNVETILSWTCHVYGPFESRTFLGTSILLIRGVSPGVSDELWDKNAIGGRRWDVAAQERKVPELLEILCCQTFTKLVSTKLSITFCIHRHTRSQRQK